MENYINYRKVSKPLKFENFTVEIGFGSGDYIIQLAKENRDETFFGIEKSWIPINKLLKKCERENLKNIFCTKLDAYWAFQFLFRDKSVKRIIINYPDPWFKKSHKEKRLTTRENLYIYGKKLIKGGEIKIRTDDYLFLNFTLEECCLLESFCWKIQTPKVESPLTKYEKKWILMGKTIWELILIKEREPKPMEIRKIREVTDLFPVKVETENLFIEEICHREFKIEEGLYLKCFSAWKRDNDYALEALLSDQGYLQAFLITIKKKDGYFIIDVSKFSEILKTEGIKKSLDFLAKILRKGSQ